MFRYMGISMYNHTILREGKQKGYVSSIIYMYRYRYEYIEYVVMGIQLINVLDIFQYFMHSVFMNFNLIFNL